MRKINETMLIDEILDLDEDITEVFEKNGLNCLGCPGAASESLAEAAEGHGADLEKLLSDLNAYLEMKKEEE
ncbi:DUF1858 domain-containing protein [Bacilliculturomica massiliensis]|uniref:DUF1858 domain-containing protein n=1 Tax=Bacilliculturomica massiliensis TaxID=1917867 RepID=UPI001031B372|nr:DUF1858 domain-containing protein [Bacilliculturomica massiliensis]